MRTQQEILDRISKVAGDDWLGFRRQVLIAALDFEHARPYLKDGATADQWEGPADAEADARRYLDFAIEKIIDHRGISASRSAGMGWPFASDEDQELMAMAAGEPCRPGCEEGCR